MPPMPPRFILMDIEGTTTDIRFVHDVLFPYSRDHMRDFVISNGDDPAVREALELAAETLRRENPEIDGAIADPAIVEALLGWIAEDRKHTALKALQGLIWREGYERGHYRGHVYPDVPPMLESWRGQGIGLGIYSSGSVEAQQLLFRYSTHGDLTPYFSHYFDTRIGAKREADAYRRITEALGHAPSDVLFLSDVEAELDAATAVGVKVLLLAREPGGAPAGMKYPVVACFSERMIFGM